MLVLTRKENEGIHIGDDVQMVVLGIKGNRVRLGFVTSPGVPILREELTARVQSDVPRQVLDAPAR